MKVHVVVILMLIKLGASEVDEELQAKFRTLSRSNFVEYFNQKNLTWEIKQYTNIKINIEIGVQYHETDDLRVKTIDRNQIGILPPSFDARLKWPHCKTISKIRNQIECGSCWAHGVADTASDRTCIHTGVPIELSAQDLECSHPHETICYGGSPIIGFKFWRDLGLVSEFCKPYEPRDLDKNMCVRSCEYSPFLKHYMKNKLRAAEVYALKNDSWQIKAELILNGPIEASMVLFQDFYNNFGEGYSKGIYIHSYGDFVALHSVRVIGYGIENGIDYWLVANSWGTAWGENGYFRIKAFQPEIGLEQSMRTGIPLPIKLE